MKSLGKVPSVTLPKFCQVFAMPWLKYIASPIVWSSLAKFGQSGQSWPHGTSDWLVSLWRHGLVVGHCLRRDSDWCVESGKRNGVTEWGWDWSFYWICTGISRCCGTHLIPDTRIKVEVGMRFCKLPNCLVGAAGWIHFVRIKNRSDWRQLHKVGLC